MKFNKRLTEGLLEETFRVIIPIKAKIRTDSTEEKDLLLDLNSEISSEVVENIDYQLNKDLYPYLRDSKQDISKQLNIEGEFKILHIDVDMERYKHTPVMEGTASFDVEIDKPLDEGETQRIFNTLINNNAVYKEFTFTMEDNYYDIFDVIVELEKTGDVEVEGLI